MSQKTAVAATFVSKYFQILATTPADLIKFYAPEASMRHSTRANVTGLAEIRKVLSEVWPRNNHGKFSITSIDMKENNDKSVRFVVKGRYTAFKPSTRRDEFTQLVELRPYGNNTFGLINDIISFSPIPDTPVQRSAVQPKAAIPPPPQVKSWSDDTPPLFAKAAPTTTISPMQQPMAPPVISPPAAPLAAAEDAEEEVAAPVEEKPKHVDPAAAEPKKEEAAAPKEAEKKEEKKEENAAPLTMLERLRLRQNLPAQPKPEPKKVEPVKPAPKEEKKAAAGKKDEEKKEAKKDGKKESSSTEAKKGGRGDAKTSGSDAKKDGKKEGTTSSSSKGGEKKALSANLVYYHLILKGLPRNTQVEDIYTSIEPHLPLVRPVKLESRADKADANTIRTFAFLQLDLEKLPAGVSGVDGAMSHLKSKKLQILNSSLIIDKVREKFDAKK